jgi:hypothetical protein
MSSKKRSAPQSTLNVIPDEVDMKHMPKINALIASIPSKDPAISPLKLGVSEMSNKHGSVN